MSRVAFLVTVISLTLSGVILASEVRSQNLREVKISVNVRGALLKDVLTELEKTSGLSFAYTGETGAVSGINLSVRKGTMYQVLKDLAAAKGLRFDQSGPLIAVSVVPPSPPPPAPGILTGKISDEKGETIPGAGVRIVETGAGTQTKVDGTYIFSLSPGTYTLEFSYVSYQTQRISGVQIKGGEQTRLDVVLKAASNALKEVTVNSTYQRASVSGLYARQKNAAGITDGISAAQIARTPDNNVGAVLKRISGLNVVDNRYVVVRGLSDRYNQAQIDGVTQPSTEMNQRNFAFDAIPAEMVSSVVVNKTATPDISSEFAGGQVSVNTLDIPVQNFTQFQIGTGYNSGSIGKNMLQAGERGKWEMFGFTNDRHHVPPGLKAWVNSDISTVPDYVVPQGRTFNPEGFRMYQYGFEPNQNYRFTLGRTYKLKNELNFGFIGGATLRNSQEINDYISTRLGYEPFRIDEENIRQNGTVYKYNATISGLFNLGLQGKSFKLSLRNMYSHVYKNNYFTYTAADLNQLTKLLPEDRIKFNLQAPENTTVMQSKLEGEHTLAESGWKLLWNGSFTDVGQGISDRRKFQSTGTGSVNGVPYYQRYYVPGASTNEANPDYRMYTDTREKDYNWGLSLSKGFDFLRDKTLLKVGYNGFYKKRDLKNITAEIYNNSFGSVFIGPYESSLSPELLGIGPDQAFYNVPASSGDQFKGQARSFSAFAMLDQRFFKKLRLVYGLRYESYKLQNTQFKSKDADINRDDNTDYLPSANVTYSLNETMNFRASVSKTVVRPDFRETSIFAMYDPILDVIIQGANLKSTKIDNADLRYEWYPAPGEIVSLSGFFKKFYKPIELVFIADEKVDRYAFQNQKSAVNYGAEIELRKSLGFISDRAWLRGLSLFGNGTLIRSKVKALVYSGTNRETITEVDKERALFGQSPWIVNAGIAYDRTAYGLNLVYNRSGYRTSTINDSPALIEYELGRDQVDLQIFTRLFKQKGELKLNVANLMNAKTTFYRNADGYTGGGGVFAVQEGKSDQYKKSEGDFITYQLRPGINFSMAFTYRF